MSLLVFTEADIGAAAAKAHFVRNADVCIPRYRALAANVRKAGCDRSIETHGRVTAKGRSHLDRAFGGSNFEKVSYLRIAAVAGCLQG